MLSTTSGNRKPTITFHLQKLCSVTKFYKFCKLPWTKY